MLQQDIHEVLTVLQFFIYSPPAFPGEARVAGGAVLPEERPRMTPPLLQCDLCLSVRCPKKIREVASSKRRARILNGRRAACG